MSTVLIQPNTVVLDLEVQHSPDWCKHCLRSLDEHGVKKQCAPQSLSSPKYERIGWERYNDLGLSIGCYYDYADDRYHYFDTHNVYDLIVTFIARQPLIVSYNGKKFDLPLMCTVAAFLPAFELVQLAARSYDILHEIWEADPLNRYGKGNGLDKVADANGYGKKLENGALAPQLWRDGEYARVVEYCTDDVWKTRQLFEQVCRGQSIARIGGATMLPLPVWGTV